MPTAVVIVVAFAAGVLVCAVNNELLRRRGQRDESPTPAALDADPRTRAELLNLLEGRRLAIDSYMWNAPSLTVAGQAFLLGVLTNEHVKGSVAASVAAAGIMASVAVFFGLWQQRDREMLHSRAVAGLARELRWGEPRRQSPDAEWPGLEEQWPPERRRDPIRRWLIERPRGFRLWEVTLCFFIAADVVAVVPKLF